MRGIAVRAGCTTGAIYPLFDSKEAIYAELLKQSLAALDAYVAEAVAKARTPEAQVEAACGAFLNYYLDHRFEINLGLYAFAASSGWASASRRMKSSTRRYGRCWNASRAADEVRGLKPSEVRPWVALLTSQMIGALCCRSRAGWIFCDTGAQTLLRMMLAQCLARDGVEESEGCT